MIDLLGQLLGYESNYFLCSANTSNDSLNNICKAIVVSGYWVTFLNLNNLNSRLMSSLSNVLSQVNERKENIQINNDSFKLHVKEPKEFSAYFATSDSSYDRLVTNSKVDSLKITKIDSCLYKISKDLLEKFQVVKTNLKHAANTRSFFDSNLTISGFKTSSMLSAKLIKLNEIYSTILKGKKI